MKHLICVCIKQYRWATTTAQGLPETQTKTGRKSEYLTYVTEVTLKLIPDDIVLVFLVWFNFNIRRTKTVTEFVYQVVFLYPLSVYAQMAQVLLNLSL